jgi:SAM-dependent methyltransferase
MEQFIISQVQAGPYSRLGWYRQKWGVSEWEESVWQHVDRGSMERLLLSLERKKVLRDVFIRYLPKNGKIIEAGCGLGQWVIVLQRMGYEIQGVEIGETTVRRAKSFFPDVPLSVGDVHRLPFPAGCFSSYVSLGVVEHREEGPEQALCEARRVLAHGGVLLCAVPFFNGLRKLRRRQLGRPQGMDFYQWSFSAPEFTDLLHKAGFEVRETIPYSTFKTLTDEVPVLKSLRGTIQARTGTGTSTQAPGGNHTTASKPDRLRLMSRYFVENVLEVPLLRGWAGHMRMFVAVKK